MSIAIQIFVLLFLLLNLLGVFSCIIIMYLGCTPCAFNEFPFSYKKK